MNIQEDYVSFETAKLLKEKGFDCETDMYYSPEGKRCCWMPNEKKSWIDNKGKETWWWKCVSPTLQMAMKWLRKEHNIVCNINIESRNFYYYSIFIIRSSIEAQYQLTSQKPYFGTYEEAAEAAIKYCLENLI